MRNKNITIKIKNKEFLPCTNKTYIKNPFLLNDGTFNDAFVRDEDRERLDKIINDIIDNFMGMPLGDVQYIISGLSMSKIIAFSEVVGEPKGH